MHLHLAARDSAKDHLQQALTAVSGEWRAAVIQTHSQPALIQIHSHQAFNSNPPSPPHNTALFFWTRTTSFCIGKVNKVPLPFVSFRRGESETSASKNFDH